METGNPICFIFVSFVFNEVIDVFHCIGCDIVGQATGALKLPLNDICSGDQNKQTTKYAIPIRIGSCVYSPKYI